MKKTQKSGYNYEKKMSEKRGVHIGGPGRPDYKRGNALGEVKATAQPVDTGTLKKLRSKRIKEVESKSGFTKPAKPFAKKEQMVLREKGRLIK
ncbi:MAG: hypothetical protein HKM07_06690 [Chlamydiae bacterium]|nr:hypothetical protein [Chlamydiota bacterium]